MLRNHIYGIYIWYIFRQCMVEINIVPLPRYNLGWRQFRSCLSTLGYFSLYFMHCYFGLTKLTISIKQRLFKNAIFAIILVIDGYWTLTEQWHRLKGSFHLQTHYPTQRKLSNSTYRLESYYSKCIWWRPDFEMRIDLPRAYAIMETYAITIMLLVLMLYETNALFLHWTTCDRRVTGQ